MRNLTSHATATQVTHLDRLWLYLTALLVLCFLVVPTLLIVPMSFSGRAIEFPPSTLSLRWYVAFFASEDWTRAAIISLKGAVLTTLIVTPFGVAAAYCTVRSSSRLAVPLTAALTLPMIMPAILIAIGLYFVYSATGLNNTLTGLVVAHVGLTLPYVFVLMLARFKTYDFRQEQAAESLGATRWQAFRRVTLPQVRPSVVSAALLAFIFAFDEAVISFFISTGSASTLPRRMFLSLQYGLDPTIAAISTFLILITLVLVMVTLALTGSQRTGGHG